MHRFNWNQLGKGGGGCTRPKTLWQISSTKTSQNDNGRRMIWTLFPRSATPTEKRSHWGRKNTSTKNNVAKRTQQRIQKINVHVKGFKCRSRGTWDRQLAMSSMSSSDGGAMAKHTGVKSWNGNVGFLAHEIPVAMCPLSFYPGYGHGSLGGLKLSIAPITAHKITQMWNKLNKIWSLLHIQK